MSGRANAGDWSARFRRRLRAPSPALVVACAALLVALGGISYAAGLLPSNSVGSHQVVNHSLRAVDFKPGQLPADRGNGWVVPNRNDLDCADAIVLDSHTISVPVRRRVWTFFQGTFRPNSGNSVEIGLYVRLLNAAGTKTLATSAAVWENVGSSDTDDALPMSGGGPLFRGQNLEALTAAFNAPRGKYRLQLIGSLSGDCGTGTGRPDFGFNQTSVYGFVLFGTA
jgi:hypothetical protein